MLKQDAARLLNVNADPVNVKLEEINNIRIIFDRIDRYISFIILSLFTSKLYFVFFQPSLPKKTKKQIKLFGSITSHRVVFLSAEEHCWLICGTLFLSWLLMKVILEALQPQGTAVHPPLECTVITA